MDLTRNPRDLISGLLFAGIGLFAVIVGLDYDFGSVRRMGPGFFPIALGVLLFAIGVGCFLRAALIPGERLEPMALRPIIFVSLAIVAFGLSIRSLGLVPAVCITVLLSCLARPQFDLLRSVILAAVLSVFCTITFIYGLGLPLAPFALRF